jgi:hypothetical protein
VKRAGGIGTPWKRQRGSTHAYVRTELLARHFNTLDDCERVWRANGDPLALMVAVSKTDLPRWLQDALLVALDDECAHVVRKRWPARRREALLAEQAWEMLMMREHPKLPQTHELAQMFAARVGRDDLPLTPGMITPLRAAAGAFARAYYRTLLPKLRAEPHSFYAPPAGFAQRRIEALRAMVELMEAALAAAPPGGRAPRRRKK